MFPGSHDLNYSNRPVRTRMPGGVGGDRSGTLTAPYPDMHMKVWKAYEINAEAPDRIGAYNQRILIRDINRWLQ